MLEEVFSNITIVYPLWRYNMIKLKYLKESVSVMGGVEKFLRELGFSERETRVYLALLSLGETTVGPIAAKTRMQHAKVYPTLEKLIDRGLVSFVIRSKTKHFQAVDPKQILMFIKEKEQRFATLLPLLQKQRAFAQEQQLAMVYEGYPAIKSMFNCIIEKLDAKSYYYVFAFKEEYLTSEFASRFLRNVHMRLAEKKVDDRLIAHRSIRRVFTKNYAGIRNIKFRFTQHALPQGLMVINNRVINWVWGSRPTAVEIVSPQIAQQYKRFFLEMWNAAR